MSGIFISYRRQDSAGWVGRLTDSLKENFGEDQIFMDIEAIEAGVDFVESINKAVGSCQVLLAVIGPRWLSVTDQTGRRRLDNPEDFIHLEIAAALQRNIRVIPVLVGGAEIPSSDQLPDDLKPLARRQAHEISDTRWEYDSEQLVKLLEKALGRKSKKKSSPQPSSPQPFPPVPAPKGISVKASIGLVLSLFVFLFLISGDPMDTNTAVGAIMFLLVSLVLGIIAFYDVKLNKVKGKGLAIGSIAVAVILCFVVFGRFPSHTTSQQGDLPSDTSAAIAQVAPATVDPSTQQAAAQSEFRP
ncbi:MAG: toll/interleukin-1 receptor domain-containing protein, partial [Bacteroidetes bacterium]|nr:toll/interleukin-1 receptor domain-containing protein [Bacteroidota bacterium]